MTNKVKLVLLIGLNSWLISFGQESIKVTSWNLCNFGKSKSASEIAFISKMIKNSDVIAIQEVSASYYGAQAVAKLADELNRTGAKWQYVLSEPTKGNGSERYAFIWKSSKLKLIGKAWLELSLDSTIDREPFLARFQLKSGQKILLSTFHAVPSAKQPQKECSQIHKLDDLYQPDNLLIMGDFNLSEKDKAFDSLKSKNILPAFTKLKTSIKIKPKGKEKFANEYDNIFIERNLIKVLHSGRIDFTSYFNTLPEARKISDHVPIFAEIEF